MKKILLFSLFIASLSSFSQKIRIVDSKLALTNSVLFKGGTAELLPESDEALKAVKLYLDEKKFISTLRIEGHVASEDAAQSQTSSEQRAQAVVNWLVEEGIDCKRLLAVGFGNTKPIVDAASPDKAANTRIVFAVAALSGHATGGMPLDGGGKPAGDSCQ